MNNEKVKLMKEKEMELNSNMSRESDIYRMKYHITPPVGWMNDPNGLCQFRGQYHVFFQYAPFYPSDNVKAWGHYVSEDLINWKYIDAPILPDTKWDKDGAYSGSALIEDDKIHLFYTGNTKEEGDYDYITAGRGANTISVTSKDGVTVGEKQCLMTNKEYPDDYTCHVRDPKVWKEADQYYMVQGGRKKGDKGAVIVFASDNLTDWKVINEITTDEPFGYMWECPDYFEIGDKKLLGCCPQGVESQEFKYQNIHQSGYFELTGDIKNQYELGELREWDMGFDFYAPQTFLDEKGRRILIGWAGVPGVKYGNPEEQFGWIHSLTLPREITCKDNKVFSYPVEEVKHLRKQLLDIDNREDLEKINSLRSYELEICFFTEKKSAKKLEIVVADGVKLVYKNNEMSLCLNKKSGAGRTIRRLKLDELRELSVFVDHSIAEIYVNHGEYVFTTRFYSDAIKPELNCMDDIKGYELWTI